MPGQRERSGAAVRAGRGRALWMVVGALVLCAVGLWVSARLTWSFLLEDGPGGARPVTETGGQRLPGLVALAVVAVAGVAGSLATGGLALAISGLAAAWFGLDGAAAVFGEHPAGYPVAEIALARALAVLSGVGIVLAGMALVLRGHRMPQLGARYRSPAPARDSDDDGRWWRALSEGDDPTTGD